MSSKAAHPLTELLWALATLGAGTFAAWNGYDSGKLFRAALFDWAPMALGGRALLALLPPGSPPERGALGWLHTSAASLALGALFQPFAGWLPLTLAALVWAWPLCFGPRAMVPRHAPFQAPFTGLDWALAALLPMALLLAGVQRWIDFPGQLLGLWVAAGLLDLCLCHAEASPRQRALALGLLAPAALLATPHSALAFAPLLSVGWLRRADRRCLALAGALLVPGGAPTWPVAGWLCLWVALSAGPSRRTAAAVLAGGVALAALAAWVGSEFREGPGGQLDRDRPWLLLWPVLGLCAALAGLSLPAVRASLRRAAAGLEGRARAALLLLAAAAACGAAEQAWSYGPLLLLPAALLTAGAERSGRGEARAP